MAAGFQAFDGAGRLTTDITDRFSLLMQDGGLVIPGLQYNNQGQNITPWTNVVVTGLTPNDTHHVVADGGVDIAVYFGYFAIRQGQFAGTMDPLTVYYSVWIR